MVKFIYITFLISLSLSVFFYLLIFLFLLAFLNTPLILCLVRRSRREDEGKFEREEKRESFFTYKNIRSVFGGPAGSPGAVAPSKKVSSLVLDNSHSKKVVKRKRKILPEGLKKKAKIILLSSVLSCIFCALVLVVGCGLTLIQPLLFIYFLKY